MILMITLSACAKTNCNINNIILPEMPIAGEEVAKELENFCSSPEKCIKLNNWLNKLYQFKVKYLIYKKKLENLE